MEQKVIKELLEYIRHKPGCGLNVVPYESYISDYGSTHITDSGCATTDKCTCGLIEILERVKSPPKPKGVAGTYVDHIQGSNMALFECSGCGRRWVTSSSTHCECNLEERVAELEGSAVKCGSAIGCEHANEMPVQCPCDDDCYCKQHSCKKGTK